jgi:hypothetical protein
VPRPYRKFHDQTQESASARRYDAGDMDDGRALPPCGRGLGPCVAVIETNAAGAVLLRCIKCECIAPLKANKNVL